MKYWIYVEPASETSMLPVWTILSEKAILAQYWDYWYDRMRLAGHGAEISEQRCIEDWVTVHWAVEATPESLLRIIHE